MSGELKEIEREHGQKEETRNWRVQRLNIYCDGKMKTNLKE